MDWIKASDKLPREDQQDVDFLVVIKYSSFTEQRVCEWWFDGVDTFQFLPDIDGRIIYKITHWKELDELPTE